MRIIFREITFKIGSYAVLSVEFKCWVLLNQAFCSSMSTWICKLLCRLPFKRVTKWLEQCSADNSQISWMMWALCCSSFWAVLKAVRESLKDSHFECLPNISRIVHGIWTSDSHTFDLELNWIILWLPNKTNGRKLLFVLWSPRLLLLVRMFLYKAPHLSSISLCNQTPYLLYW